MGEYLYMKQKNRVMLDVLANLAYDVPLVGHEDVQHIVAQCLSTAGVPFPSRPASKQSRPSSSRESFLPEGKRSRVLPTVNLGGGIQPARGSARGSRPGSFRGAGMKSSNRPASGNR